MKQGDKLEIDKLEKPAFLTEGEWKASLEAISLSDCYSAVTGLLSWTI